MPMLILLWVMAEEGGEWREVEGLGEVDGGENGEESQGEQKREGGGERGESNISNEDHNQTYCLTG